MSTEPTHDTPSNKPGRLAAARQRNNHSLDRVDNEKGYFLENCRWATGQEQARNRRSSRLLEYNGETKCVTEWAETLGIPYLALSKRIGLGWTAKRALETPIRKRRKSTPKTDAAEA